MAEMVFHCLSNNGCKIVHEGAMLSKNDDDDNDDDDNGNSNDHGRNDNNDDDESGPVTVKIEPGTGLTKIMSNHAPFTENMS